MPYQSERFPGSICGLEQIVSCYVRTTVPGSDRTAAHRSYHHPPSPPRPRPFISGATRRPEIMPANNPRPVGRRPRCGICSLNLACRRLAGQQQNNFNAGSMLIRPKVHIGQIFNFRVDADWTVRKERLLLGLYLSGLVGLWPNLWQWKVSRRAESAFDLGGRGQTRTK